MDSGAGDTGRGDEQAMIRGDMEPNRIYDRENSNKLREAAQDGDLELCQKIIDAGVDLGDLDKEGISVLHWAAINGKMDIAKLLLANGADINSLSGKLSRSSLQWAIRYNQFKMMNFLLEEGADIKIRDEEGCEAIHLAARFGSIGILAYLLTKGIDPNLKDSNGNTPLMWACSRSGELDMIRLLLSFGVDMSIQADSDQATALHRAIDAGNWYGVQALLEKGSPLKIKDINGLTARSLLEQKIESNIVPHFIVRRLQWSLRDSLTSGWLHFGSRKLSCKGVLLYFAPAIIFAFVFAVLELDVNWQWKAGMAGALAMFGIIYVFNNAYFKQLTIELAIPISLSTKVVYYLVWFLRIAPATDPRLTMVMLLVSAVLWYNFLKGWLCDPGVVKPRLGERFKTISELGKAEAFSSMHFCATCIIRRPMRSKHCAICNRCVAKFDHHCVYLGNCVGRKNHLNFMLYMMCMVTNGLLFLVGCGLYWSQSYDPSQGNSQLAQVIFMQSPMTALMFGMVVFHISWIFWLLMTQIRQILFLGMTTNENLNQHRYGYLREGAPEGKNSVFNRGVCNNLCDFLQISPCCPCTKRVNWYKTYWPLADPNDPTVPKIMYIPQASEVYQPFGYPGYRPGSTSKLWPPITFQARNHNVSVPFDSGAHVTDYNYV